MWHLWMSTAREAQRDMSAAPAIWATSANALSDASGSEASEIAALVEPQVTAADVAAAVAGVDGVGLATVRLVWEPAWTSDRASEDAQLALGL